MSQATLAPNTDTRFTLAVTNLSSRLTCFSPAGNRAQTSEVVLYARINRLRRAGFQVAYRNRNEAVAIKPAADGEKAIKLTLEIVDNESTVPA